MFTIPSFKSPLVSSGAFREFKTEFTLTLIISLWSNLDLPYVNVLTPTVVESSMTVLIPVTPKNWVNDFEV